MGCFLLSLVSCAALVAQEGSAAGPPTPAPQNEDPLQREPVHPELQDLVQDDLRRRDQPSEKLDTSESGAIGWLLLEWGGARQRLEDYGLRIEMINTTDSSVALTGGADPGGTAVRNLLDLTFSYDTGPALGWHGGTLLAGVQWITSVDGSSRFGVLQPFSSIDAERRLQVGRLWYEQFIERTDTRLRVGKIDANSLFAYVETGARFLHSSMGFSPTIFLMPTYPDAAFGGVLVQALGGGFGVRGGVFDGALAQGVRTGQHGPSSLFESPHGLFLIGEADFSWGLDFPGRAGLGAWRSTADLERFDGGIENGTDGIYALLEQRLWKWPHEEQRTIDAFLQLGSADPDVSPFESHLGLGVVWSDSFAPSGDHLGLGMTHAGLSRAVGAGFTEKDETAFELFYGFELLPWVNVKPAVQYVMNPGGDATLDDAWIATLRFTLSL